MALPGRRGPEVSLPGTPPSPGRQTSHMLVGAGPLETMPHPHQTQLVLQGLHLSYVLTKESGKKFQRKRGALYFWIYLDSFYGCLYPQTHTTINIFLQQNLTSLCACIAVVITTLNSDSNRYHKYAPGTFIRTLHILIHSVLNTSSSYGRGTGCTGHTTVKWLSWDWTLGAGSRTHALNHCTIPPFKGHVCGRHHRNTFRQCFGVL